jgi:acyl carrier protein
MSDLREQLQRELVSRLKIRRPIDADTALFSGGLLDSLSVLEVVTLIEELVGKPVPPEDITLENFDTVTLIAAFAARLRGGETS